MRANSIANSAPMIDVLGVTPNVVISCTPMIAPTMDRITITSSVPISFNGFMVVLDFIESISLNIRWRMAKVIFRRQAAVVVPVFGTTI